LTAFFIFEASSTQAMKAFSRLISSLSAGLPGERFIRSISIEKERRPYVPKI